MAEGHLSITRMSHFKVEEQYGINVGYIERVSISTFIPIIEKIRGFKSKAKQVYAFLKAFKSTLGRATGWTLAGGARRHFVDCVLVHVVDLVEDNNRVARELNFRLLPETKMNGLNGVDFMLVGANNQIKIPVIEIKKGGMFYGLLQLSVALLKLYEGKKIYGICTNSYQWSFLSYDKTEKNPWQCTEEFSIVDLNDVLLDESEWLKTKGCLIKTLYSLLVKTIEYVDTPEANSTTLESPTPRASSTRKRRKR